MRSTAAAALTLVSGAHAFWRMPCRSETGIARMDPIMDKGEISDHVHTIAGSGKFSMDATYDDLTAEGACTSCAVTQDKSAYWTPALYFVYSNGSSVMVPQVGGLLAYYLYYMDNVQAFPEGFQMVAGNKNLRSFNGSFPDEPLSSWPGSPDDQKWLGQRALGFNCLNYGGAAEPSLYRHEFPSKSYMDQNCPDGMRLEIGFPSCGTGEADSDDHKSHVAYPNLVKEGKCPEGYDVNYPFLFFETIWATNKFAGEDGEFALSHGDPVGTGYHGDFMMGWESKDFLQKALDTCQNDSGRIEDCPLFDIQQDSEASKCAFEIPEVLVDENVKNIQEGIPMGVPLQHGPADATAYPCVGREGSAKATKASSSSSSKSTESAAGYLSKASSAIFGDDKKDSYGASSFLGQKQKESSAPAYEASSTKADIAAASITASPSISEAYDGASGSIVSTKYVTENGEVLEIAIEQVDQTVTATASQGAEGQYRRHLHNHKRHGGARL